MQKRRALMGRRKNIAAPVKPVAKKPKPPAAAALKPKTAAAAAEKEKKPAEKAPEKSIFETQLENLLDDDGGLRLVEKTPNFVWLMRNALKNVERSLVVTVIHRPRTRNAPRRSSSPRASRFFTSGAPKRRRRTSRAWC